MAKAGILTTLAIVGVMAAWTPACRKKDAAAPASVGVPLAQVVVETPQGIRKPPFTFSSEDERLLDEVQRGAFNFLWNAGDPETRAKTGMAPDRNSKPTVSTAGVGFQLSGICIGVERGWITREQGRARAALILRALADGKGNRKAGFFYHFIHHDTAGQPEEAYEHVVSTIDSSLLFAGILTASAYFGGEVAEIGDALFTEADWTFFIAGVDAPAHAQGFLSLGWRPDALEAPGGSGSLIPYYWLDSGDEHRLVTLLAVCAPTEKHRVDPALYYKLRRQVGSYADSGTFVWFPWSGALFTNTFAHCWINYAALGVDDPSAFGIANRPRVDWWENSRRAVIMHRAKAVENPKAVPTLGVNAWGLTASDVEGGYAVPGLFPNQLPMPGAIPEVDFALHFPPDNYGDGTIAPYGAGSAIMFDPAGAVAAMRYYQSLSGPDGTPLVWMDPAKGGYGFADAFNLGTGWVAADYLAIDQGPLLLAIENARTGLVWDLFHGHPFVRAGLQRLKQQTLPTGPAVIPNVP